MYRPPGNHTRFGPKCKKNLVDSFNKLSTHVLQCWSAIFVRLFFALVSLSWVYDWEFKSRTFWTCRFSCFLTIDPLGNLRNFHETCPLLNFMNYKTYPQLSVLPSIWTDFLKRKWSGFKTLSKICFTT